MSYYIETANQSDIDLSLQIFTGTSTSNPVGLTADEVTIFEEFKNVFLVTYSFLIPNSSITQIWVGRNGIILNGAAYKMSGFYTYISDTDLQGTIAIDTGLPFEPTYNVPTSTTGRIIALETAVDTLKKEVAILESVTPSQVVIQGSILYQKRWISIGDSISAGTNDYNNIISNKFSIIYNQSAISGTTLGGTATNAMVNRFDSVTGDYDYITVYGGTNDKTLGTTLGSYGDTTNATFFGSVDLFCRKIIIAYPYAKIGFITPRATTASNGTLPYVDAIIKVCADYALPVLDLYNTGGVSRLDAHKVLGGNDYIHPTTAGQEFLATKVERFMLSL